MYSYLEASSLLDFDQTIAKPLFDGVKYPWEVLPKISDFIIALGETLDPNEYEKRGENIWIAKSAKVYDSAYLTGPLIVCANAEIRHCAFIRGSVIVGEGAVIGNSTELKIQLFSTMLRFRTITMLVILFLDIGHIWVQAQLHLISNPTKLL